MDDDESAYRPRLDIGHGSSDLLFGGAFRPLELALDSQAHPGLGVSQNDVNETAGAPHAATKPDLLLRLELEPATKLGNRVLELFRRANLVDDGLHDGELKVADKLDLAYDFFEEKLTTRADFTLQELADATGWAISTPETYVSKRWAGFLERIGPGTYRVRREFHRVSRTRFRERHTQISPLFTSILGDAT